ncbi:hypothetical protein SteCoe_8608 [Stentor coeruleus]|uniref:C-type lectin domain-containing protein n=1 Tax=Stentor coeruleus TaxID=5963 RepID=A0A1R2CJL3_9CILI|nr:hypothetical protein SteCoe_8608 [Stentor coeruleus]
MLIIRFFLSILPTLGQKFTLNGEAAILTFIDDASYTLYNEEAFYVIDSTGIPAITLTQQDTCSLEFDRRMIVHGSLLASTEKAFQIENNEQWKLVVVEDFQGQILGWSEDDISSCSGSIDYFLGGHCKFSNQIVSKSWTLPKHEFVMLQITFHFLDKWEGESAYMKVDGNYVWSESYQACNNLHSSLCVYKGIDVCGDDFPDRIGYPVKYTGKHTSESIMMEISTTLDRDPCEASWGIDDVQIFIK